MNNVDWIDVLTKIFVDKKVVVESINSKNPKENERVIGIVKAFHSIGPGVSIELVGDICQCIFVPKLETLTGNSVEGDASITGMKRSIRLA